MLFYTAVFTAIIRAIYGIAFIVIDDVCKIRLAVIIVFPVKGATVADIGIRFEEIYQPVFPAQYLVFNKLREYVILRERFLSEEQRGKEYK
jgi:hypothetical protein